MFKRVVPVGILAAGCLAFLSGCGAESVHFKDANGNGCAGASWHGDLQPNGSVGLLTSGECTGSYPQFVRWNLSDASLWHKSQTLKEVSVSNPAVGPLGSGMTGFVVGGTATGISPGESLFVRDIKWITGLSSCTQPSLGGFVQCSAGFTDTASASYRSPAAVRFINRLNPAVRARVLRLLHVSSANATMARGH